MFFNINRDRIKHHFISLGWKVGTTSDNIWFEKGDLITSTIHGFEKTTSITIYPKTYDNGFFAVLPYWLNLVDDAEVDASGLDEWIKEVEMKYKLARL